MEKLSNNKESKFKGMGENLEKEWENELQPSTLLDALDLAKTVPQEAIKELEVLAKDGSALAMFYLGSYYNFGKYDITQDFTLSKYWWKKSKELGSLEASFSLARRFELEGDYRCAINEHQSLVKLNFYPSKYILGLHYYKGDWFEKDIKQSIELFKAAEKQGHLHAKHWHSYILRKEKLGVLCKIRGWLKWLKLIIPFIYYQVNYPNSDRLRR